MTVFGITYSDKTTEFKEWRNDKPVRPWRWENDPIIEITDTIFKHLPSDEIVGVVSWKFPQKTGVSKEQVEKFIRRPAQVYNFSTNIPVPNFMDWSDRGHKGIKSMIQRLCQAVGLKYDNDPQHIIYANQFVARNDIYQHYVRTVLKPCIDIMETSMWDEINREAGYTRAMHQPKLRELTGLEFYNYFPFICERLLMQYVSHYGVKCLDYHK